MLVAAVENVSLVPVEPVVFEVLVDVVCEVVAPRVLLGEGVTVTGVF